MRFRWNVFAAAAGVSLVAGLVGVAPAAAASEAASAPAEGPVAPDGRIAFESNGDIWVINADGTGETNLTNSPDSLEWDPSWSFDGTKLAFISDADDYNLEVFTMNADGSEQTQVTFTDGPEFDPYDNYEPAWSPDGSQLVFVSSRESFFRQLYIINVDGTGEVRLTDPADFSEKLEPSWSPDGSKIVYTWWLGQQDIHTISVDGTGDTNLTPDTLNWSDRNPAWSPDGTRIAWMSEEWWDPLLFNSEIVVMQADGTGQIRVTDDPHIDVEPSWSPDGTQLTFSSTRGGTYDLYVIDVPPPPPPGLGGAEVQDSAEPLTSGPGNEQDPSWGRSDDPDSIAPVTRMLLPAHHASYPATSFRQLKGSAADNGSGVAAVDVAIRQKLTAGGCRWFNGTSFVAGGCNAPVWLDATGTTRWMYRLPVGLEPSQGTSVANYTGYARSTDGAGNIEIALDTGRNANTFEITP